MTARIALVTGGSGGIGTAIVQRLARMGHKVATNYRDEAKARAWADNLKAGGTDVVIVPGDVANPASAEAMVKAVEAQLGLKLKAEKSSIPILVIDHIEQARED